MSTKTFTEPGVESAVAARNDRLALAALALHGPVDVGTTLFIQEVCGLEDDNPVVEDLGRRRWLQVKGGALALAIVGWRIGRTHPAAQVPLGLLVALGVLFVLPNVAVAARCGPASLSR